MKWRSLQESDESTDARPLREIFAERKELIAKYVPSETQAIHAQAVAELKARRMAANILPVGAHASPFELPDHDGKIVSSSALLSKGSLVVCFIRGRWCPFCVGQVEAMNLALPQIKEAGANLVAISPQTVKQSYFMHDQHKLRFPLLSDTGNKVARAFGLTYRVPAAQEAVYRGHSSICHWRTGMTVGSCRFRQLTFLITTGPFCSLWRMRITRSGRSPRMLLPGCENIP